MTEQTQTPEKAPEESKPIKQKRSYARLLYKDIAVNFLGHRELLGTFSIILNNVAWGDYFNEKYGKPNKAGEFLTTYKHFSELAGVDNRTLQRELSILVAMGLIRIEKRTLYLLGIMNLNPEKCSLTASEASKLFPKPKRKMLGDGLRSKGQHVRRRPNIILGDGLTSGGSILGDGLTSEVSLIYKKEEVKEESKKKKPSTPKIKPLKFTVEDMEIAKIWLEFAIQEMPWTKLPKAWTEEGFASEIATIRKVIDLNQDGLKAVLNFIKNDKFWCKNALSPAGMLKISKNTGLRKIDTILVQMKTPAMRQIEKVMRWKDEPEEEPLFIF